MRWLALLICLALASCRVPEPPLRIGISPWPPTEIAKLAEHLGYLSDSNVTIVEFHSPAEAGRAYLTGGLDAVALTMDYVLHYNMQNDEHRAFLVVDLSNGADTVLSHAPVPDLARIAGRRIGLEPGPLGGHMLRSLLEKAGITYQDVEMVFVERPDHRDAFLSKKVDLLVTYEPTRGDLVDRGAVEVFTSKEIPGEIVDVFVARVDAIDARQDDFRAFTTAWFSALQDLDRDPLGCAALIAPRLEMTAEKYLEALQGVIIPDLAENRRMLGAQNNEFISRISHFVASVNAGQQTPADVDLKRFLTSKALPPERQAMATFGKPRD